MGRLVIMRAMEVCDSMRARTPCPLARGRHPGQQCRAPRGRSWCQPGRPRPEGTGRGEGATTFALQPWTAASKLQKVSSPTKNTVAAGHNHAIRASIQESICGFESAVSGLWQLQRRGFSFYSLLSLRVFLLNEARS